MKWFNRITRIFTRSAATPDAISEARYRRNLGRMMEDSGGAVQGMVDVYRGNAYPGFVADGDEWTGEETRLLEQAFKQSNRNVVGIYGSQYVVYKDQEADGNFLYSYRMRSWSVGGPVMADSFEELMVKLGEDLGLINPHDPEPQTV